MLNWKILLCWQLALVFTEGDVHSQIRLLNEFHPKGVALVRESKNIRVADDRTWMVQISDLMARIVDRRDGQTILVIRDGFLLDGDFGANDTYWYNDGGVLRGVEVLTGRLLPPFSLPGKCLALDYASSVNRLAVVCEVNQQAWLVMFFGDTLQEENRVLLEGAESFTGIPVARKLRLATDGKTVYYMDSSSRFSCWNVKTGTPACDGVFSRLDHRETDWFDDFEPSVDGSRVAVWSWPQSTIWIGNICANPVDIITLELAPRGFIDVHSCCVHNSVAFVAASILRDNTYREVLAQFDLTTGQCIKEVEEIDQVNNLSWDSVEGKLRGFLQGSLASWSATTLEKQTQPGFRVGQVLAIDDLDRTIICASTDGAIVFSPDFSNADIVRPAINSKPARISNCFGVGSTYHGRCIICLESKGENHSKGIFDYHRKSLTPLHLPEAMVNRFAYLGNIGRDAHRIAFSDKSKNRFQIFNFHTMSPERKQALNFTDYADNGGSILEFAFSENLQLLATTATNENGERSEEEYQIEVTDLDSGRIVTRIFSDSADLLRFSPEARFCAALNSNRLRIIDLLSDANRFVSVPIRWLRSEDPLVLRFSSDEAMLFVGTNKGRIMGYSTSDGRTVFTIDAHDGAVTGLVHSKCSPHLFSSGKDNRLRQWQIVFPTK